MQKHTININVTTDKDHNPEHIDWTASGSANDENPNPTKAFFLSLWDPEKNTALHIDLWTKRFRVDEMNSFIAQTLITMADTYNRATKDNELTNDLKEFAQQFKLKADAKVKAQNEQKQNQKA